MKHTSEKAIHGVTSGLINKGETVTWQAKHFLKLRRLQIRITKMEAYSFFEDDMIEGDFKKMQHKHYFKEENQKTTMADDFYFESPFGWFGKIINWFFLKKYMRCLLQRRNQVIKQYAESEKWKIILS